jgi:hypothetical protein
MQKEVSKLKKRIIVLPAHYQETLLVHEMKYEKQEIDFQLIRNLVYLYSVSCLFKMIRLEWNITTPLTKLTCTCFTCKNRMVCYKTRKLRKF